MSSLKVKKNNLQVMENDIKDIEIVNLPDEDEMQERVNRKLENIGGMYNILHMVSAIIQAITIVWMIIRLINIFLFHAGNVETSLYIFDFWMLALIVFLCEYCLKRKKDKINNDIIPPILRDLYYLEKCMENRNIMITSVKLKTSFYYDVLGKRSHIVGNLLLCDTVSGSFKVQLKNFEMNCDKFCREGLIMIDYKEKFIDLKQEKYLY
jgi:hypothetical protein